jgi:hypothetical protein
MCQAEREIWIQGRVYRKFQEPYRRSPDEESFGGAVLNFWKYIMSCDRYIDNVGDPLLTKLKKRKERTDIKDNFGTGGSI